MYRYRSIRACIDNAYAYVYTYMYVCMYVCGVEYAYATPIHACIDNAYAYVYTCMFRYTHTQHLYMLEIYSDIYMKYICACMKYIQIYAYATSMHA